LPVLRSVSLALSRRRNPTVALLAGSEVAMRNRASGVDLGTSPHGLSADVPVSVQETPQAASCRPPAKPVLIFSLTESQRDALAFAALCEAEDLADGHEADELEVQAAIRNLWEARKVLLGGAL
jgi:hypothetical protein